MGRRWYCRVLGEEFGPLSFRQLARLVREGSVTADDDVRPDFQERWQASHSVIGLYRMAFRSTELDDPEDPVAVRSSSASGHPIEDEEEEDNAPAPLTLLEAIVRKRQPDAVRAPPSVITRIEQVTSPQDTLDIDLADLEDLSPDEIEVAGTESQLSGAIADAMSEAEARSLAKEHRSRLSRIVEAVASLVGNLGGWDQVVRRGVVWVAPAVAANGAAWALLQWSSLEQRRFPSGPKAPVLPFFPGLGRCSELEYGLFFGHAIVLAGLMGFFAARWCVSRTE